MGEASACNLSLKNAGEPLTVDDFQKAGVKPGDILIAWGDAAYGFLVGVR
jgi:hypothetical protein